MSLLRPALNYAERGLRVLPLEPGGKRPLRGSRGCSGATTDADQIRAWWDRAPDAGLGVVPGPLFWVLDVDTKPPRVDEGRARGRKLIDGFEAMRRLCDLGFALPGTLAAKTPSGGHHYWFLNGEGMRPSTYAIMRGALAGLDVRAEDSYVVVPPTVTKDGEYTWINRSPVAEAPAWLLKLMARRDSAATQEAPRPLPSGYEQNERKRRWCEAVLRNACERVRQATTGRHDTWFREAVLVGGALWGLDGDDARAQLEAAAQSTVQGRQREIRRTITQGLESGSARPVYPEERR